ncbi:Uma2 family endonuclease [Synechococcus moorigangaii CMS01]|nr:Uma2 family endonuclease [Synechococcus moorigangaii CMS01]
MGSSTVNFTLSLPDTWRLSGEQFFELCQNNPDCRFELSTQGELIIMPPTGGETGRRNMDLSFQVRAWERNHQTLGVAFDSSTCFKLPNGAHRSPDAAWVSRHRWDALTAAEKAKFPPLCPDFVVEIRSPSDRLQTLQEKMQEYQDNGAKLGWLIDPTTEQVEIYRENQAPEILEQPDCLSGEQVLSGFELDLNPIWHLD